MRNCTVASSAVVGSSAITIGGPVTSAEAISARWRRPPESWWGFSDRFWHRVLGVKTWRYKDWERCHNGCPQLPGDHWDAFGRGKRISALVTQPYYGPALDEYEAAWRAAAVQYGLRLYVSAEESWHKPGKTVLFVLSTPDDGGR